MFFNVINYWGLVGFFFKEKILYILGFMSFSLYLFIDFIESKNSQEYILQVNHCIAISPPSDLAMILLKYFVANIYNAFSYVDICVSIYILPRYASESPANLNISPPPPPFRKKIWIRAWEASEDSI